MITIASAAIHISIAKKYLEKHPNLNYDEFIKGTLYPDVRPNNVEHHYPKSTIIGDFAISVYNKVDLYAFLQANKNLDDFKLGYFLHLVTDYLFFRECLNVEYLKRTTPETFKRELYHAYDTLDSYLILKYNITKEDYKAYPYMYSEGIPYKKNLLNKELIDKFITRVSSIDLDKYIQRIKDYQDNIKPE